MLNERLAGNSASAARRRIEWLKLRRKHWKQIYEYVTTQDAAITLAMIEEASQQVASLLVLNCWLQITCTRSILLHTDAMVMRTPLSVVDQ